MFDPNKPKGVINWDDVNCEDYYFCNDCEDDCGVDEKEEKEDSAHVFKGVSVIDDCSLCGERYAHKGHA